jgi:predicted RNase H-like HicB family nuclease
VKGLNYIVLFEPMAEGGYMAIVPVFPGIITYGSTLEEARTAAEDAIRCHCEGLLKDGESLPENAKIQNEPVEEIIQVRLEAA